jgi:hypothetical protein
MRKIFAFAFLSLLVVGFVATTAKLSTTASGSPEQTINSTVERIQNEIINDMVNYKYVVESQTSNMLVMVRAAEMGDNLSAYFLVGNAYSKNERLATYTFIDNNNGVRVIATPGIRARMVGGQVNTRDLLHITNIYNEYQKQLNDLKYSIESN